MKTKRTAMKPIVGALIKVKDQGRLLTELAAASRSLTFIRSFVLSYSFRALEIFYQVYK